MVSILAICFCPNSTFSPEILYSVASSTFSLIFGSLPVVMFGAIAIGMAFMGDSIGGHVLQVSPDRCFTPVFLGSNGCGEKIPACISIVQFPIVFSIFVIFLF